MSDDEENYICVNCGSTPCDWIEYHTELQEYIQSKYCIDANGVKIGNNGDAIQNNNLQKLLYKRYTYLRYGHLGQGVRIQLPNFVTFEIKRMFPSEMGNYMGFKEE